ncbi:MAG: phage tail protein I [Nannocystaceae bacterium]|nr:phage tail protein I [Myxococcales bacterium]
MSRYLDNLPAWMRRDPALIKLLTAFERILDGVPSLPEGVPDPPQAGLSRTLDKIHSYFRPGPDEDASGRAPAEFLPWLAGWVAVSLREDWGEETRRRVVAEAVDLYRLRGTKAGLRRMLEIYVGLSDAVRIYEFISIPHYFQVEITLPQSDPTELARTDRAVRAIIDQEKPAHTFYGVRFHFPSMQIVDDPESGKPTIRIGVNTLLGSQSYNPG